MLADAKDITMPRNALHLPIRDDGDRGDSGRDLAAIGLVLF